MRLVPTEPRPYTRWMSTTEAASEQIIRNVEAVSALYETHEQRLTPHQRGIDGLVEILGGPWFLYAILGFVGAWIVLNLGLRGAAFDPAPFVAPQGLVSASALLMATLIVITQNRQGKLEDQRAHIDLQVNLLAEKKIAKLIALVEELRRDLPTVHNRYDAEATAMQTPADPTVVARVLEGTVK